MDGANVEMFDEVGADNMFIFGMSSDESSHTRTDMTTILLMYIITMPS